MVNLYDFDNTIYDGESLVDFFWFCFIRKKNLACHLPSAAAIVIAYEMKLVSIEKVFEVAAHIISYFVRSFDDFDLLVKEFWKLHAFKLKPEFMERITSDDIITTASPSFLINGIRDILKTRKIISSEYDKENGRFKWINFGDEKVTLLKSFYPDVKINDFYTNSLSDLPLTKIAQNSFLVRGSHESEIFTSKTLKFASLFSSFQ